jgi:hypothetical protein
MPGVLKATALRAAVPERARAGRAAWRPVPPQRAGQASRFQPALPGTLLGWLPTPQPGHESTQHGGNFRLGRANQRDYPEHQHYT